MILPSFRFRGLRVRTQGPARFRTNREESLTLPRNDSGAVHISNMARYILAIYRKAPIGTTRKTAARGRPARRFLHQAGPDLACTIAQNEWVEEVSMKGRFSVLFPSR